MSHGVKIYDTCIGCPMRPGLFPLTFWEMVLGRLQQSPADSPAHGRLWAVLV